LVLVDYDSEKDLLTFTKQAGKLIVADTPMRDETDDEPLVSADGVALPLPSAASAPVMSKSKGEDPTEG
jgi:hypothetical protein